MGILSTPLQMVSLKMFNNSGSGELHTVCYVTLSLTPSGLNFLFQTLTAVQGTDTKCKIIVLTNSGVR